MTMIFSKFAWLSETWINIYCPSPSLLTFLEFHNGYRGNYNLYISLFKRWTCAFIVFCKQSLGCGKRITDCSNFDFLVYEIFHIHSHHRIWTTHIVHDKKSLLRVSRSPFRHQCCNGHKVFLRITYRDNVLTNLVFSWKLSLAPFL